MHDKSVFLFPIYQFFILDYLKWMSNFAGVLKGNALNDMHAV